MPFMNLPDKKHQIQMCQNPPGDEIYTPYCGGKLHQIDMPPSYTIVFSQVLYGVGSTGIC